MDMLSGLLVFGTFWFWALIALHCVALTVFLELDRVIFGTVITIFTALSVIFMGNIVVFPWILGHPWQFLSGIACYFLIAVIWVFIKWTFYARNIEEFAKEKKLEWIRNYDPIGLKDEQKNDYKQTIETRTLVGYFIKEWELYVKEWEHSRELQRTYGYWIVNKSLKQPKTMAEIEEFVEKNKGRIISWMTYWPWSMLWTLLNDPIRRIMKHIYYAIRGLLIKIAANVFGVSEIKEMTTK